MLPYIIKVIYYRDFLVGWHISFLYDLADRIHETDPLDWSVDPTSGPIYVINYSILGTINLLQIVMDLWTGASDFLPIFDIRSWQHRPFFQ